VGRLDGRTVLVVLAHPDDESLACGGTLARLADEGARIVLLCASRGERGSQSGPVADEGLAGNRARELAAAAGALGIGDVLLFDHPDGDLRWAHVAELHAQIALAIRHYEPSAVITFAEDGLYWHLDHIAVHERTTTVVRSLGRDAPALYYVAMPPGVMRAIVDAATARGWTAPPAGFWSLPPDAFGDGAKPPTIAVQVQDWVPRKLAGIRCHQSQMGSGHPFAKIDEAEARRWLGVEHFRRMPDGASTGRLLEELA
jgi:LmbE family N-acetylglucosaminyl deacetylase